MPQACERAWKLWKFRLPIIERSLFLLVKAVFIPRLQTGTVTWTPLFKRRMDMTSPRRHAPALRKTIKDSSFQIHGHQMKVSYVHKRVLVRLSPVAMVCWPVSDWDKATSKLQQLDGFPGFSKTLPVGASWSFLSRNLWSQAICPYRFSISGSFPLWKIQQIILVGGIPTPLKNMSSSVGMMKFPIYGKIKNVPNHQPAMVTWTSSVNSGRCLCKFLMLQQQIEDHFWSMHPMTTGCWLSWFQRSKMSQLYLA